MEVKDMAEVEGGELMGDVNKIVPECRIVLDESHMRLLICNTSSYPEDRLHERLPLLERKHV